MKKSPAQIAETEKLESTQHEFMHQSLTQMQFIFSVVIFDAEFCLWTCGLTLLETRGLHKGNLPAPN